LIPFLRRLHSIAYALRHRMETRLARNYRLIPVKRSGRSVRGWHAAKGADPSLSLVASRDPPAATGGAHRRVPALLICVLRRAGGAAQKQVPAQEQSAYASDGKLEVYVSLKQDPRAVLLLLSRSSAE